MKNEEIARWMGRFEVGQADICKDTKEIKAQLASQNGRIRKLEIAKIVVFFLVAIALGENALNPHCESTTFMPEAEREKYEITCCPIRR